MVGTSKPMSAVMFSLVSKFGFPLFVGFRQKAGRSGGMIILIEHKFCGIVTKASLKALGRIMKLVRPGFPVERGISEGTKLSVLVDGEGSEEHSSIIQGEDEAFTGDRVSSSLTIRPVKLLVFGCLV